MMSFSELTEDKGGKNLHLEHAEDLILDHGVDSQEFKDYQTERSAIKVKYPKE